MAVGRYRPALARLESLSARWPGRAQVEYRLGVCEAALGHVDAALTAWERVPRQSPWYPRATLNRARLAFDQGRLAIALASLVPILVDNGQVGAEASRLADQVDLFMGRRRAISRRIEHRWAVSSDQAALLRLHWQLDSQPTSTLAMSEALDRMALQAPEDDGVWLGRAALATASGRFDEADRLLTKCEARGPDDPDVVLARLDWALDAGHLAEASRAASRLPASRFSAREVAAVIARLAALNGAAGPLRAALKQQVELEPGNTAAWDRLAELAVRDGLPDHAAGYRRRKAEMNHARDDYARLMGQSAAGGSPRVEEIEELARTAEALGRRFEARGWWSIRARQSPDDHTARAALERLAHPDAPSAAGDQSLADLIPVSLLPAPAVVAHGITPSPTIPTFRDDAQAVGLRFVYDNDPTPLCRLPETMGGGIGVLDYDGDGWLDVYAVGGGSLSDKSIPLPSPQRDRLFRNRGDATFEDVTERVGLAAFAGGYGHGVTVGDYDNDGRPDVFVSRWRSYALYRNRSDGSFRRRNRCRRLGRSARLANVSGVRRPRRRR